MSMNDQDLNDLIIDFEDRVERERREAERATIRAEILHDIVVHLKIARDKNAG